MCLVARLVGGRCAGDSSGGRHCPHLGPCVFKQVYRRMFKHAVIYGTQMCLNMCSDKGRVSKCVFALGMYLDMCLDV